MPSKKTTEEARVPHSMQEPRDVWTIFGRWRRRSPESKRLGLLLLLIALALVVAWVRTPRGPLAHLFNLWASISG
jgi:hypothetical protein